MAGKSKRRLYSLPELFEMGALNLQMEWKHEISKVPVNDSEYTYEYDLEYRERIESWIESNNLESDREILSRMVALLVPAMVASPQDRQKAASINLSRRKDRAKSLSKDPVFTSRIARERALFDALGLSAEHLKHAEEIQSRERFEEIKSSKAKKYYLLRPMICFLFKRLDNRGIKPIRQRRIVFKLFRLFEFDDFADLPENEALNRLKPIRNKCLEMKPVKAHQLQATFLDLISKP